MIEILRDWRTTRLYNEPNSVEIKRSLSPFAVRSNSAISPLALSPSLFLFLFIRKSEQLNGAQFGDQAEGDVIEKKATAATAPGKLTLFREESLKLSRNALIGLASFLIRFQLRLADIFARSFSYSSSRKEKKEVEKEPSVARSRFEASFSPLLFLFLFLPSLSFLSSPSLFFRSLSRKSSSYSCFLVRIVVRAISTL